MLLTWDNPRAGSRLAAGVAIEGVRADLLPQDEMGTVKKLECVGRKVAPVAR
ncbi:hypothetical protein GQF42_42430 [Streptomyces broussonetiae]|uniref:Uncharacterized protein n=1 Tax=Streptomyces broussonetiae TaxID=2686304 RepID=A0A6I6N7X6_9ACTN|nr:hypothetical protein [Streptomyces broussonetiae]QHA09003.1 hypothetical protein GQF42_42430 [Streptomyces broussonetiae]